MHSARSIPPHCVTTPQNIIQFTHGGRSTVSNRKSLMENLRRPALRPPAGDIEQIVGASMTVFGWREGGALTEIALASWGLRSDATIVESGVFMGRSTALLAGARRLRGSGKVHCVDPFDCSGDAFSIPHYLQALKDAGGDSLEEVFRRNMTRLGIEPWIVINACDRRTGLRP